MGRIITEAIVQGIDAALRAPKPVAKRERVRKRPARQCAEHAYTQDTLARLDSRSRVTLWLVLALLLHSLGAGPVTRLIDWLAPIAESAASESAPE